MSCRVPSSPTALPTSCLRSVILGGAGGGCGGVRTLAGDGPLSGLMGLPRYPVTALGGGGGGRAVRTEPFFTPSG